MPIDEEQPTLHMTVRAPDAAQQYIGASLDHLVIVVCPYDHDALEYLIDASEAFERNATHYLFTGENDEGTPWRINMVVAT